MVNYKPLYIVFASLMLLLIATIAINFIPLGRANTWVAMLIAATKTLLLVTVFMGLAKSKGSVRLAAGAGILWLGIAITLIMSDYATRGWDETQAGSLKAGDKIESLDGVDYMP